MFGLTLAITLSPNEAEIHEDAVLRHRMETEFSDGLQVHSGGADLPAAPAPGPGRVVPRAGASSAFTPGGYANGYGNGYGNGNGQRLRSNGNANGNGQDRANGYHGGQPVRERPARAGPATAADPPPATGRRRAPATSEPPGERQSAV